MEFVHGAVQDGGYQDSDDAHKDQPAEQGVKSGKDFAWHRIQVSERAHAGEDHGSIGESIHPVHSFEAMIAAHSDEEGRAGDSNA